MTAALEKPEQSEPRDDRSPSLKTMLKKRAEDRKRSGPRTTEGKNVSRMNAMKHGFCSTYVTEDENADEIAASRARWIADLGPDGEAQETLADLAFRQMRRLDRVLAAEEAAVGFRVGEVREEIRADHAEFLAESLKRFEDDPFDGVAYMLTTGDGVSGLLITLDQCDADVRAHRWCPRRTARLLALEGAPAPVPDAPLELVETLFAARRSDEQAAKEAAERGDADAKHAAERRMKEREAELNTSKELLLKRIQGIRTHMRLERVAAQAEEAAAARAKVDAAKVDGSDRSRLLRRYAADAQREFLRALRDFLALKKCSFAPPVPKPLVEPPPPAPDPIGPPPPPLARELPTGYLPISIVPRAPAPNEPMEIRNGFNDRKRRPKPPAERKPRRRR